MQRVNCASTEGLFRIIQSIPSLRAEPLKRWLVQVGYPRAALRWDDENLRFREVTINKITVEKWN